MARLNILVLQSGTQRVVAAYVLTGSPGVGKHTVSEGVARALDLDMLDLNRIAADARICEDSGRTADVDVAVLGEELAPLLSGRSLVVGHLAPYVLTGRQVRRCVIMRSSPYGLRATYEERGYPGDKTLENLQSEILGITAYDMMRTAGAGKTVQVDATGRTIQETVSCVVDAARGASDGDHVDWLAAISSRGDVERFFPTIK